MNFACGWPYTLDWTAVVQALRKDRFAGYEVLDVSDCPDREGAYFESRRYLEEARV